MLLFQSIIIYDDYVPEELKGLRCLVVMSVFCSPVAYTICWVCGFSLSAHQQLIFKEHGPYKLWVLIDWFCISHLLQVPISSSFSHTKVIPVSFLILSKKESNIIMWLSIWIFIYYHKYCSMLICCVHVSLKSLQKSCDLQGIKRASPRFLYIMFRLNFVYIQCLIERMVLYPAYRNTYKNCQYAVLLIKNLLELMGWESNTRMIFGWLEVKELKKLRV